jgi:hypothetical protein
MQLYKKEVDMMLFADQNPHGYSNVVRNPAPLQTFTPADNNVYEAKERDYLTETNNKQSASQEEDRFDRKKKRVQSCGTEHAYKSRCSHYLMQFLPSTIFSFNDNRICDQEERDRRFIPTISRDTATTCGVYVRTAASELIKAQARTRIERYQQDKIVHIVYKILSGTS